MDRIRRATIAVVVACRSTAVENNKVVDADVDDDEEMGGWAGSKEEYVDRDAKERDVLMSRIDFS